MSFSLTQYSHSYVTTIPLHSSSNEFDNTAQEDGRSTAMMKRLIPNLRDCGYLTFLPFSHNVIRCCSSKCEQLGKDHPYARQRSQKQGQRSPMPWVGEDHKSQNHRLIESLTHRITEAGKDPQDHLVQPY